MSENEVEKTLLPPNYLSLAQLQDRWLKQKQLDEEEKEQKRIQHSKEAQQQRHHLEQQNDIRRFREKLNKSRKYQNFDLRMQREPVESRNRYHQVKAKARKEDDLEKKGGFSRVLGRNNVENEGYDGKFQGKGNACAGKSVSAEVLSGKVGFRGPSKRNCGDQRSNFGETEESERMGEGSEGEKKGRHLGSVIGSEEKSENTKMDRQRCRGPSKRNSRGQRSKVVEADESARMEKGQDGETEDRVVGLGIENEEKGENRDRGSLGNRGSSKRNGGEKRSVVGEAEIGEGLERENKGRVLGSGIGSEEKGKNRERGRKGSSGQSKRNDGDQESNVGEAKQLDRMGGGLEGEKKGRVVGSGIGDEEKGKNQGMGRKVNVGYRFRGNWVRQERNEMKVRVDFPTEVYKKNEGAEGTLVISRITGENNGCGGGLQEIEEDPMVNGEVSVSLMEGRRLEESGERLGAVKETADAGTMASQRNIARLRYKGGYQWNSNKNVSGEKTEKGFEELPLNDEKTVKARRWPRTNGGYRGNHSNHMSRNNRMHKCSHSGLIWVKKGVISDANSSN